MARPSSKKGQSNGKPQQNAETEERLRLKNGAFSKNLLSSTPSKPLSSLTPSKLILKHHGTDIVKKGQRKNKFLFSFPGLLAPISGGKMGELKDLGSKNPILYIDFPQGRMKLFGTIVYPKNKYLTLQVGRAAKYVVCEDSFESMVVFSDAWWIGKTEDNPEEHKLEFPKELNEGKRVDCDFKGGAGATCGNGISSINKPKMEHVEPLSPDTEPKDEEFEDSDSLAGKNLNGAMNATPVRQSARTSGRKFNFAESSSGDDEIDSNAGTTDSKEVVVNDEDETVSTTSLLVKTKGSSMVVPSPHCFDNKHVVGKEILLPNATQKSSTSVRKSKELSVNKGGKLVQATISTLFEKVEEKKSTRSAKTSPKARGSALKGKLSNSKQSPEHSKMKGKRPGKETYTKQTQPQVEDDDIEEVSSESQETK